MTDGPVVASSVEYGGGISVLGNGFNLSYKKTESKSDVSAPPGTGELQDVVMRALDNLDGVANSIINSMNIFVLARSLAKSEEEKKKIINFVRTFKMHAQSLENVMIIQDNERKYSNELEKMDGIHIGDDIVKLTDGVLTYKKPHDPEPVKKFLNILFDSNDALIRVPSGDVRDELMQLLVNSIVEIKTSYGQNTITTEETVYVGRIVAIIKEFAFVHQKKRNISIYNAILLKWTAYTTLCIYYFLVFKVTEQPAQLISRFMAHNADDERELMREHHIAFDNGLDLPLAPLIEKYKIYYSKPFPDYLLRTLNQLEKLYSIIYSLQTYPFFRHKEKLRASEVPIKLIKVMVACWGH